MPTPGKAFHGTLVMVAASLVGSRKRGFFVQILVGDRPMFNFDARCDDAYEARCRAWTAFLQRYVPGWGQAQTA
jgi:hypothetical protein